jgi:dsRNA-specific ribonuclease
MMRKAIFCLLTIGSLLSSLAPREIPGITVARCLTEPIAIQTLAPNSVWTNPAIYRPRSASEIAIAIGISARVPDDHLKFLMAKMRYRIPKILYIPFRDRGWLGQLDTLEVSGDSRPEKHSYRIHIRLGSSKDAEPYLNVNALVMMDTKWKFLITDCDFSSGIMAIDADILTIATMILSAENHLDTIRLKRDVFDRHYERWSTAGLFSIQGRRLLRRHLTEATAGERIFNALARIANIPLSPILEDRLERILQQQPAGDWRVTVDLLSIVGRSTLKWLLANMIVDRSYDMKQAQSIMNEGIGDKARFALVRHLPLIGLAFEQYLLTSRGRINPVIKHSLPDVILGALFLQLGSKRFQQFLSDHLINDIQAAHELRSWAPNSRSHRLGQPNIYEAWIQSVIDWIDWPDRDESETIARRLFPGLCNLPDFSLHYALTYDPYFAVMGDAILEAANSALLYERIDPRQEINVNLARDELRKNTFLAALALTGLIPTMKPDHAKTLSAHNSHYLGQLVEVAIVVRYRLAEAAGKDSIWDVAYYLASKMSVLPNFPFRSPSAELAYAQILRFQQTSRAAESVRNCA